ncbi:MAG TPA: LysR family transcriptional regulator [Sphingomonas sp.]|jgi:DNA-binding transcriptional LysR family regulator|uniref:LysR family transcriptional regulator n=1 Tax=Sphingomonas sp. TaxID=28214 RepID=UPI002ED957C1
MLSAFDLNLRHLRALSAIAAHGSMSAAAAAVSLSQPALTQGLAKLERRIGTTLFVRRSDGMIPTDAGRMLIDRVDAAFTQLAGAGRNAGRPSARGFGRPEHLMTSTQMYAFLSLADAGSFVDAAGATGLSQPALHRAVRDLEQICGVVLVERRGRGVALSTAGRRLARGLRLAAAEIAAGLSELAGDGGQPARLAIGAMPLSRALVLPRALDRFLRTGHPVAIEVFEGAWRDLVEPLRDGVIDLMLGALRDPAPAGLVQQPLFEDRLTVVGRAGHPLTTGPTPKLAALADYGWIVGQPGTPLRAQWDAMFAGQPPPAAPIVCGSVMVIRGLLRDSDLLTLLSPDQIALEVRTGILTAIGGPLDHGVRTIGITTRADWRPTQAQRAFIACIHEAVRSTRVPENE